MTYTDAQRLAFGTVADRYERHRPAYPPAAIERLLSETGLRPGDAVLEIGAGTGKLTEPLAAHGLQVLAVEPSAEMTAVARAKLPNVTFVTTDFERFVAPRRFDAVACAAAWHWLDPERRFELARAALRPGGSLVLVWNFADWSRCPLREPLAEAYHRTAPDMPPRFSMHPDTPRGRLAGDLVAEAHEHGGFRDARMIDIPWTNLLTTAEYLAALQTHQDHILLEPAVRERLLAALAAVLDGHGGTLELPMLCRIGLATAA